MTVGKSGASSLQVDLFGNFTTPLKPTGPELQPDIVYQLGGSFKGGQLIFTLLATTGEFWIMLETVLSGTQGIPLRPLARYFACGRPSSESHKAHRFMLTWSIGTALLSILRQLFDPQGFPGGPLPFAANVKALPRANPVYFANILVLRDPVTRRASWGSSWRSDTFLNLPGDETHKIVTQASISATNNISTLSAVKIEDK